MEGRALGQKNIPSVGAKPDGRTLSLIYVLFTLTFFVYYDFGIRTTLGYVVLLAAVFLILLVPNARIRFTNGKITYLFLAFVIVLQIILPYSTREKRTVSMVLSLVVSAIMVLLCETDARCVRWIFRFFILASGLLSLYVLLIHQRPEIFTRFIAPHITNESVRVAKELMRQGYGISIGANVVLIDYIVVTGMIMSFALFAAQRQKRHVQAFYICHIMLCFLGILMENRKSEMVCGLVALIVIILLRSSYDTRSRQQRTRWLFYAAAMLALVFFAVLLARGALGRYTSFFKGLTANMTTTEYVKVDVSSGRTYLWKKAGELFLSSPFFGIGWGNFAQHVTTTYNAFTDSALSNVHNNYLQFLCESGIVGFTLIMLPVGYLFVRTVRKTQEILKAGNHSGMSMNRAACTVSLGMQVFFLVLGFIDPTIYKMVYWCFYGLAIILMEGAVCFDEAKSVET